MSAIYSKAPEEVSERAKPLLEKHHFELFNHELKIDFIFANASVDDAGAPSGPAVSHNGYPAAAVARILSIKDRVMGRGDCEIVIDADRWPVYSDEEKDALLDHELEHFQIAVDKYGAPKLDDIHRPKLKLKKHDHQFGWFDNIARRYGLASGEVRQFQMLCYDESGQYYLPHIGVGDHDRVKQSIRALMPPRPEPEQKIGQIAKRFVKNIRKSIAKGEIGSVTISTPGMEPVEIKGE